MPRRPSPIPRVVAALDVNPGFERLASIFARDPRITSGRMMASLGLKVSGKLFAMYWRGALTVKLPRTRVEALLSDGAGTPFAPRGKGSPMREWVTIVDEGADEIAIAKEALAFVDGAAKTTATKPAASAKAKASTKSSAPAKRRLVTKTTTAAPVKSRLATKSKSR